MRLCSLTLWGRAGGLQGVEPSKDTQTIGIATGASRRGGSCEGRALIVELPEAPILTLEWLIGGCKKDAR